MNQVNFVKKLITNFFMFYDNLGAQDILQIFVNLNMLSHKTTFIYI